MYRVFDWIRNHKHFWVLDAIELYAPCSIGLGTSLICLYRSTRCHFWIALVLARSQIAPIPVEHRID